MILLAAALAGCSPASSNTQPTPTTPQISAPEPSTAQPIVIDTPSVGTVISSPLALRGRLLAVPPEGGLIYRLLDAENIVLASGTVQTSGVRGQPGTFAADVVYTSPGNGPGSIQVVQRDVLEGPASALAVQVITLTQNVTTPPTAVVIAETGEPSEPTLPPLGTPTAAPAPPTPTQLPPAPTQPPAPTVSQAQAITIASPPPGTAVGSPVVITGSTTRFPAQGTLKYRFIDRAGNQLGAGEFAVSGSAGQAANFNASLVFNLPQGGGPVRFEVADRDTASGQTLAAATLDLVVNPPATVVPQQQITITSPPPGTTVGSPMTITGTTANFPTGGNLGYRVFDASNRQIGVGAFPVNGGPGQPANFNAQIVFTLPPSSGDIRVELIDRNDTNGNVLASSSVVLRVAVAPPPTTTAPTPAPTATVVPPTSPPNVPQELRITEPVSGTVVGAPLIITGTATLYPLDGNLFYIVRDEAGAELGSGTFNVPPQADRQITFSASLRYNAPAAGTVIRVELVDQNDRERSAVRARTEIRYQFQPNAQPR